MKPTIGHQVRKLSIILFIMVGGCVSDFQTKKMAEQNLKGQQRLTLIDNVLDLGFSENRGMVFGILNNKLPSSGINILVGIRMVLTIGLSFFMWVNRQRSLLFLSSLALIWAGALGNSIDLFLYGYVIDFIHIQIGNIFNWPFYFNLADAYILVGTLILVITNLMAPDPRKIQHQQTS